MTGVQNKARKHLCRLRLQADEDALTPKFFRGEVKFKKAKSKSSWMRHFLKIVAQTGGCE